MLDSSESVLPTNRRQTRRIAAAHNAPILIGIENRWIPAIDISTGGFSFRSFRFSKGEWYYADIDISGESEILSAVIEIADVGKDDVCHCRFKTITIREKEVIARYIRMRENKPPMA